MVHGKVVTRKPKVFKFNPRRHKFVGLYRPYRTTFIVMENKDYGSSIRFREPKKYLFLDMAGMKEENIKYLVFPDDKIKEIPCVNAHFAKEGMEIIESPSKTTLELIVHAGMFDEYKAIGKYTWPQLLPQIRITKGELDINFQNDMSLEYKDIDNIYTYKSNLDYNRQIDYSIKSFADIRVTYNKKDDYDPDERYKGGIDWDTQQYIRGWE